MKEGPDMACPKCGSVWLTVLFVLDRLRFECSRGHVFTLDESA